MTDESLDELIGEAHCDTYRGEWDDAERRLLGAIGKIRKRRYKEGRQ